MTCNTQSHTNFVLYRDFIHFCCMSRSQTNPLHPGKHAQTVHTTQEMEVNLLPGVGESLGRVEAPRRPEVFLSFTDEGSNPNGPKPPPPPDDSWGCTFGFGLSSGLGETVDLSNFLVPPIGGGGGGGGGAGETDKDSWYG